MIIERIEQSEWDAIRQTKWYRILYNLGIKWSEDKDSKVYTTICRCKILKIHSRLTGSISEVIQYDLASPILIKKDNL